MVQPYFILLTFKLFFYMDVKEFLSVADKFKNKTYSAEDFCSKVVKSLEAGTVAKTKLPLVYNIDGKLMLAMPNYIEDAKDYILGAAVGSVIIGKNQVVCDYQEVQRLKEISTLQLSEADLLSVDEFKVLEARKWCIGTFNEVMKFLQKHGVEAELLDENGEYWTRDKATESYGLAYSLKNHYEKARGKFLGDACYARLIWKMSSPVIM